MSLRRHTESILCPCCRSRDYPLDIDVPDGYVVSFDLRKYTNTVYCNNCNRRIKYSLIKVRTATQQK